MNIDSLIAALIDMKTKHGGDAEVNLWEYAGASDELVSVVFDGYDDENKCVLLSTKRKKALHRRFRDHVWRTRDA